MPRLGTCRSFYCKNFSGKTLMIFEDCADPNVGCSILLRGANIDELSRVKKVAKFMILACYNWKLEKSFLRDIGAKLPETKIHLDEVDQNNTSVNTPKVLDNTDHDTENNDPKLPTNENVPKEVANKDELEKNNAKSPLIDKDSKSIENKGQNVKLRKTDSDRSVTVPIKDFSDPLRSSMNDEEVFLRNDETVLLADCTSDRWSTDDVVLTMSPNVLINPPFLTTEAGKRSPYRKCFAEPLFLTSKHQSLTPKSKRKISRLSVNGVVEKKYHPFTETPITTTIDDPSLRASLAYYRATAGLTECSHQMDCPQYQPAQPIKLQKSEKENTKDDKLERDPLDPENHQQLNLLLYSYSAKSANVPDFCVNPWTVTMEMYGRRDITLGAFLDKYCFNGEAKCPSSNCSVPMNQHVRKFVHEDVCITITWNSVEHSTKEEVDDDKSRRVMYWNVCSICSAESSRSFLSYSSLRLALSVVLSLAQKRSLYELSCGHSLQVHNHYYAKGGISNNAAAFRYSKIRPWDIIFPPEMITTKYDTKLMRDSLLQQVNDLILRGHETFASLTDNESEKDHLNFKQHMEHIHLALTSDVLSEQTTKAGVVRSLWSIYDRIIIGEKMRRDAQDKCSQNKNTKAQPETVVEEKQETESMSSVDSNMDLESIVNKDETDKSGEDDEDKENKKTVRQLLLQLLSNNQTSNQNGIIITSGLIPVVVSASEVGSVIAATLATAVCKAFYANQLVNEESDSNTSKEKNESDKSKTKSNEHIEVQLKEGLICRVYFAQQFHKLRHMLLSPLDSNSRISDEYAKNNNKVEISNKDKCDTKGLCDIEEGFIRSLAHCVPWAAKGGKSGSTFCKTKDDRYVLKEMTKPEWQQFLEFAPHYFNYVYTCRQSNLPSLLARIVGVFSVGGVGGAASGVLVLEHLFYERDVRPRFDLKGSQRHRLAQDSPHSVLMDENLLNLRWKAPFYLQSHTASVLFSAIERDSEFLSNHCVMDYSLLLGVYEDKLVLGIIDYIRTFTWDKKLEHIVKKNLGPGQPTVVSPEQYKARFIEAMKKYFLHCVAHWDHLQLPLCDK